MVLGGSRNCQKIMETVRRKYKEDMAKIIDRAEKMSINREVGCLSCLFMATWSVE